MLRERMDALARAAMGINSPALTAVSLFIDNDVFFVALVLALILLVERRNNKRLKIITAIMLAVFAGMALKGIYAIPRPCYGSVCPPDYSFPSLHAVTVFTLMLAFLDKREYPFFLLFAIFVAFTRLHLGVHTFEDIAAAFPVAILAYHIVDSRWPNG
jgi:membrane-associated phospholipid phosphatase